MPPTERRVGKPLKMGGERRHGTAVQAFVPESEQGPATAMPPLETSVLSSALSGHNFSLLATDKNLGR